MSWSRLMTVLRGLAVAASAYLLFACASGSPPIQPQPAQPAPPDRVHEHHTVALLGATGMVGRFLIQESLARGYVIRALARTPAKLEEFRDRITIVQGDARDPATIQELLRNSDVVISALGPVKADGEAARYISTTVTGNVLREMEGKAISQYMVVSGAGVVMPGDNRNLLGWWTRTLAQIGLRDTLQDKQAEYALLAESSANWMLVRCPLIDPEPFLFPPLVSLETPPAFRLRAAELARFMVDQIDSRDYLRQGPFLGSHEADPE